VTPEQLKGWLMIFYLPYLPKIDYIYERKTISAVWKVKAAGIFTSPPLRSAWEKQLTKRPVPFF
jgi:hypothetical protein